MYDELGYGVLSVYTEYQPMGDDLSFSDIQTAPPSIVDDCWSDAQVLPPAEDHSPLKLMDDPFVLPGAEDGLVADLKSDSDDWLTPLFTEGETTVDEIVVTANPRTPGQVYNDGDYGGWDGHDTNQDDYRDPDPIFEFCDAASDNAALRLRDAIKEDPNDHRKEHVALIFRDSRGIIMTSPLFEGTDRSANVSAAVNWLISQGHPTGNITGLVHNHDRDYYGRTEDEERLNRYPSDADWAAAQILISLGADPGVFRHYIVDTNGEMREFDYDDRLIYESLSIQQKINGRELPPSLDDPRPQCY